MAERGKAGMVGHGWARRRMARTGVAGWDRQGEAGLGKAGHGRTGMVRTG
jgi:hypothetical protein